MNPELLSLKAVVLIQAADLSSVLELLQQQDPQIGEKFLTIRRRYLHALLENYEDKDPALAAKLQGAIDKHSTNFPFDY